MTTECGVHKLVADVSLFFDEKVLVVKYRDTSNYNGEPGWFLPDDLLHHLEHPEAAARRILQEQVSLSTPQLTLALIESFKGNDDTWHMTFHYKVSLPQLPQITPGENVKEAQWFSLDNLPPESDIAHHGWALTVLNRIQ